jgi:hypothetical protein
MFTREKKIKAFSIVSFRKISSSFPLSGTHLIVLQRRRLCSQLPGLYLRVALKHAV